MINEDAHRLELELVIEASPENITIEVYGERIAIGAVDNRLLKQEGRLTMYTSFYTSEPVLEQRCAAVIISRYGRVLRVVEPTAESLKLSLPSDSFALLTKDRWFAQRLQELFHIGELVKLRIQGEVILFDQLMALLSSEPHIVLDQPSVYTVTSYNTMLTGVIEQKASMQRIELFINGEAVPIRGQGRFQLECSLTAGDNVITLQLYSDGQLCDARELHVYCFIPLKEGKSVFLWVEQGHNVVHLSEPMAIRNMLKQAKSAGVTDVVVDVKGIEGFAGYKQAKLTGRPYVSCMQAPGRAGANPNLDFLHECTEAGKEYDLNIHAAFNVFAEGSYYRKEFAMPELLEAGGQHVLHANDHGQVIVPHQHSNGVSSGKAKIAYVNPADDHIRALELRCIEEVIEHYAINGIVLDRCRYDDEHAEFSNTSRDKFSEFLAQKGKSLYNWPEDIFSYRNGARVDGPLLDEWWTFRAQCITSFVKDVRMLVDRCNARSDRKKIQLSTYVGSWYEYAYRHGINWASPSFQYEERYQWPDNKLYTDRYAETGYIGLLDFIIIGAYQQTLTEIEHYIAMAHHITDDEIPIITGVALPYVQHSPRFPSIIQTALGKSSGVMLFDHCHIDWSIIERSMPSY